MSAGGSDSGNSIQSVVCGMIKEGQDPSRGYGTMAVHNAYVHVCVVSMQECLCCV